MKYFDYQGNCSPKSFQKGFGFGKVSTFQRVFSNTQEQVHNALNNLMLIYSGRELQIRDPSVYLFGLILNKRK